MNARKIFLPSLLAAALFASGCSTLPEPGERTSLTDMRDEAVSGWSSTPAVVYRTHRQAAELLKPAELPSQYYDKLVELELSRRVTIEELASLIQLAGVPTILATDELKGASVFVPSYNGPLGLLLDSIGTASTLSFTWNGGALVVDKDSPYLLRIPQNDDLATVIGKALASMGAESVDTSKEAGLVSFRASARDRARIEAYLDRLSINTSMVNLQLAVMNVSLDREHSRGLDWSSVSIKAGELGLLDAVTTGAETVAGAAAEAVTDTAATALTGNAVGLTGGGASFLLKRDNLSLQGVLNMLSTYGESRTVQNLTLKTLSGVPVKLRSGESIPYIEDVSLNVNENSSTSGIQTTTVDIGFEIEASPFYDAEDNLVTIDLDLSMKSLIGFRELSTGNQLGTISRPQVQEQAIENIARLAAGETALIGGLVYESVSDSRNTLTGLENYPIGSKKLKTTNNALFVLMRPTVVVYGPRPVDTGSAQ